ncbi:MAG TPA: glycoside hydrolase family 99-like domain-containing protein [Lysobacter sp.]|nr:glycoside hydrolase family 99-like domain-containing protein [Lysobacter sp.]
MAPRLGSRVRGALFRTLRLAFRLAPLSGGTRDRWRQAFLNRYPGLIPNPARGRVLVTGGPRLQRPLLRADQRAIGYVEHRIEPLPQPLPATVVAFYLPQFHPIPENDRWWGTGFTEWHNVTRALPQFEGHAQPRLPGALGYYDLRNPETMRAQAKLAREYGIGAFCFYFYWFGGTTLLEQPLRQWLADPTIDLPFCLCWANEPWSRRWDGRPQEVLIDQRHSPEDDLAFIRHVADYLRDPRCLRVDGRPLLLVYRPGLLPDARATAARWRAWCREHGIGEIHLAYVQAFERPEPADIGFDAAVEFPPNLATPREITGAQLLINPDFHGHVLDWRELAREYVARGVAPAHVYPGVNCGWDNEPRRPGRGRIYLHASPRGYRDWLHETIAHRLGERTADRRLVFVNAWNEWAEGAVLEPDARLGHAWLQATRDALAQASVPRAEAASSPRPCAVVHAWYPDVLEEILETLKRAEVPWQLIVTTAPEVQAEVEARLQRLWPEAELCVFENRGRDILPFLRVASRLADEGEPLILKLHTKRSTHRHDGGQWRRELVDELTAPARVAGILAAFRQQPTLGLVAPDGHIQPLSYFWGANRDNVEALCVRLGLPLPRPEADRFAAGSMFWVRTEALRPLLDAHLDDWLFEPERGQVDGTFAHAVERAMALAVCSTGCTLGGTSLNASQPNIKLQRHRYPYADRF